MELDEAIRQATPAQAAPATRLEELEAKALQSHVDTPQRANAASRGFALLREGLALLSALGHSFHVQESGASPIVVFPQMLYKSGVGEMTVHSQSDLETALADGWCETPDGLPPAAAGTYDASAQDIGLATQETDGVSQTDSEGGEGSFGEPGSDASGTAEGPGAPATPARDAEAEQVLTAPAKPAS